MSEDTEKEHGKLQKSNGKKSIELTPIQLLEVMLRCVLKDRITDEEIETICSVYYKTVKEWWG
jgi:hypothetical protein